MRSGPDANAHLDTDYHEIMLKPQVAELLPHRHHTDEPAIDMAIPSLARARRVKHGA